MTVCCLETFQGDLQLAFDGQPPHNHHSSRSPQSQHEEGLQQPLSSSPPSVEFIVRSITGTLHDNSSVSQSSPADAFLSSASLAIAQMMNRRMMQMHMHHSHHHHHSEQSESEPPPTATAARRVSSMMQRLESLRWIAGDRHAMIQVILGDTSRS
jgi:hypothetical protein